MNHRKERERLALAIWRPFDGPQVVPEEASAKRLDALRRWRGQDETDTDEKGEQ